MKLAVFVACVALVSAASVSKRVVNDVEPVAAESRVQVNDLDAAASHHGGWGHGGHNHGHSQ